MGSRAPSSPFPVGTASRLPVPGRWPHGMTEEPRGLPAHPFPPSLLPVLSHRLYNLRRKPIFRLVLARLQAAQGPWLGSALPATVDPPAPSPGRAQRPSRWPPALSATRLSQLFAVCPFPSAAPCVASLTGAVSHHPWPLPGGAKPLATCS